MTREEHLKFCKTCNNRKSDFKLGLICGLTDKIADFEEECDSYEKDLTPPPPRKNNVGIDTKEITEKFTPSNLKRILLGFIPVILALIIYYLFGNTRQSTGGIISIILIIVAWSIFYSILRKIFFPKSKNSKIGLILALVTAVITISSFDKIVYGGDINSILAKLDENSPNTKTIILDKEFRDTYMIKRKEIPAKWIYNYRISVNNKIVESKFASTDDLYKVGDSILVAFDKKTPEISKILKKIN